MPTTEDGQKRLLDFFLYGTLRIRFEADLDRKVTRFGRPCQITMKRSRLGRPERS